MESCSRGGSCERVAQVMNDLNNFGICVVDNFLGEEKAELVYSEAVAIYQNKSLFKRGQLVNDAATHGWLIRGDHIAWLDGAHGHCPNMDFLMRSFDSVITDCVRCDDQGELGLYKITKRTKAMLACYPGRGTRYYKHVDNPNFDGRKITCVYYLNKDWRPEQGGSLRIYPEDHQNHVANIDPIFDRLVIFWADRRNPHEVLPSERVRLSVTLWYLDDNELAMQNCINSAVHCDQMMPFN